MRNATEKRKTSESDIHIDIAVDGSGKADIHTGIGFLDHMLETFALHGGFDITIRASGDLHVDPHHTTEDLGITLGKTLQKALGDKRGIRRAGFFLYPMDESLATVAVDLCGRTYLRLECPFAEERTGDFPVGLLHDFFWGFTSALQAVIHIRVENGRSAHHQAESIFKALSRALRDACSIDARARDRIPSAKGVL